NISTMEASTHESRSHGTPIRTRNAALSCLCFVHSCLARVSAGPSTRDHPGRRDVPRVRPLLSPSDKHPSANARTDVRGVQATVRIQHTPCPHDRSRPARSLRHRQSIGSRRPHSPPADPRGRRASTAGRTPPARARRITDAPGAADPVAPHVAPQRYPRPVHVLSGAHRRSGSKKWSIYSYEYVGAPTTAPTGNKLPGRRRWRPPRAAPGFVRADQLVLDHPRPEEARQLIEGHALLRPGDERREGDFARGLPQDVAGLRVPELQPETEDRDPCPHDLEALEVEFVLECLA